MRNSTRALELAKEYIPSAIMHAAYDCCDSMNDAEKLETQFGEHSDLSIGDFIKKNLEDEYYAHIAKGLKSGQYEEDNLKDPVTALPLPWPKPAKKGKSK